MMNRETTATVIVNQVNHVVINEGLSTLADVISQLPIETQSLAIAVNNDIVTRATWPKYIVANGDKINVFSAIAGG